MKLLKEYCSLDGASHRPLEVSSRIEASTRESPRLKAGFDGRCFRVSFDFEETYVLPNVASTLKWFRGRYLQIQLFEELEDDSGSEIFIGGASVDVFGLLSGVKIGGERESFPRRVPLICPWSEDLRDCYVDVDISFSSKRAELDQKPWPKRLPGREMSSSKPNAVQPISPPRKPQEQSTATSSPKSDDSPENIFIDLRVVRAVEIPSIHDVNARYLFVGFAWNSGPATTVLHRTHSVEFYVNPNGST
ncbi:hypothetical protein BC829DRAFT_227752 [Chytridium lagenaria]|nr:hypothetical protein BC829DRAFT_227752 [Chytridium lagenaria]